MSRSLIWIEDDQNRGWSCSYCSWRFPVPTLLSDPDAKAAYDRLAAARFREHACASLLTADKPSAPQEIEDANLEARVRAFIKGGYKPKDAVEIVLQELALEYHGDPKQTERAKAAAETFLHKVRKGLI
jgi:hypothetical protein